MDPTDDSPISNGKQPQSQPGSSASAGSSATRERSPRPDGTNNLGLNLNVQPVSTVRSSRRSVNAVILENPGEIAGEKRKRGRPPGSKNKERPPRTDGSIDGRRLAFHNVVVQQGENIVSRLIELSDGPRTIFVVSANGSIHNLTLRLVNGDTVYHKGQFEIATLSGSSVVSDGILNSPLKLTISFATPDGRLFGGVVTRELIAASSVHMVVGSFVLERSNSGNRPPRSHRPTSAPVHVRGSDQAGSSSQDLDGESSDITGD